MSRDVEPQSISQAHHCLSRIKHNIKVRADGCPDKAIANLVQVEEVEDKTLYNSAYPLRKSGKKKIPTVDILPRFQYCSWSCPSLYFVWLDCF